MATLGDPLADLTWFLGSWGGAGAGRSGNPANVVTEWPGALTQEAMFERYAARTGRTQADTNFYRVFSAWKGIVILEGLYSSFLQGNAANPSVERFREQVPAQLARALEELDIA
jgi:aminoglycoside phosphotransferase (APT) family kinase protein